MDGKLLTPKEFYASINGAIGLNTIYKLVRNKDFPSLKIGARYYIIEAEIATWLAGQTRRKK